MRPYASNPFRQVGGRPDGSMQKTEKIDIAWLRKLALNFEKRISKNTELRAKFEARPEKYVRSLYTSW